jgi:hypothetical protein
LKLLTKGDKIVLSIILIILGISSALIFEMNNSGSENKEVVVKVEGKVIKEIPVKDSPKDDIYSFGFNNDIGYIEIKDGRARMLEMDTKICPQKICSNTGWIDKGYQEIVCLPNKITVSIKSVSKEAVDSIAN